MGDSKRTYDELIEEIRELRAKLATKTEQKSLFKGDSMILTSGASALEPGQNDDKADLGKLLTSKLIAALVHLDLKTGNVGFLYCSHEFLSGHENINNSDELLSAIISIIHPSDTVLFEEAFERAKDASSPEFFEIFLRIGSDHSYLDHRCQFFTPVRDWLGKPKSITIAFSKWYAPPSAAETEERFFKTLFEKSSIGMSIVDLDGKIIAANSAVANLLEYAPSDLEVLNISAISDPDDFIREKAYMSSLIKGLTSSYQIEKRYFTKNGRTVWVRLNATLFENENTGERFMLRVLEDITAAKETEDLLHKKEKIYASVFNSISDAIIVHDPNTGQIFDANASALRMYGYTIDEITKASIVDLSEGEPPYSVTEALTLMQRSILIGPQVFEWRCKRKNGDCFWGEVSLLTVMTNDSYRTQAVIRDMTDRREHDKAMRMVQFSVDKAGDSIIWINKHSRILYTNEIAEKVYGYSRQELLKMSIADIDHNFRPELWIRQLAQVRELGYIEYETLHRTLYGSTFPVEVKGHYMNFEGEEGIFAIIRDVSQKKHAEEQQKVYLSRLERMVEIIAALLKSGTIDEISEMSLRKIVEMTQCHSALIELYDFHAAKLTLIQFKNSRPAGDLTKTIVNQEDAFIPHEILRGEPAFYSDITKLESIPAPYEQLIDDGIRSIVALPMMADDRLIGSLVMYDLRIDAFSAGRAEIFSELASSLSLALKQIRLQEQIQQNTLKLEENIRILSFSRFALENAGEGVLWFDASGRIFYANASVCEMLELEQSRLIEMNITEIDKSLETEDIEMRMRSAMNDNYWLRETEVLSSCGKSIPVEITSTYFEYENNGYFIEFIRDITERKQSELALLRSEETYRIIVEQTRSIVFDMRLDSKEIKWLGPIEEILGWTPSDFPDQKFENWLDIVHPDDRQLLVDTIEDATERHQQIEAEYRVYCKNGELKYFELSGALIQNSQGQFYRLLGSQRDITQRVEARNELRRYTSRLEQLYELDRAILSGKDMDSIAEIAIERLHEQLGSDRASMYLFDYDNGTAKIVAVAENETSNLAQGYIFPIEKVFTVYNPHSNSIKCIEDLDAYPTKTPFHFEIIDSGYKAYATIPIFIEEKHYGCLNISYRTPTKFTAFQLDFASSMATSLAIGIQNLYLKKQIEDYTNELENKVLERTLKLESANKELEAFSYSVSHDLRAPLRAIDGFAQALFEDYTSELDQTGKDYVRRIRNASQRMALLIDDMLKLSRVTRHELATESIDLSEIAKAITAEISAATPEREVSVSIEQDMTDTADPQLVKIALTNLFENAFKFTSKKEIASIQFGYKDENGGRVYFIKDNGAGFDMKFSSKLFGAFQRLHKAEEYPGTGIGLATVQRIISKHGGRVWADSIPNVGTTFFFTLHHFANGVTK